MRHSLLVPPIFIIIFLFVFIFLTAIHSVIGFGSYISDTHNIDIGYILQKIPYSMILTLPASVLLTILLMLFRLIRSGGNKLISPLLLLATAFFVLVGGMSVLIPALPPEKPASREYRDYIEAKRFNRIDDIVAYPVQAADNALGPSLVSDPSREDWKLYSFPFGSVQATPSDLEVKFEGFPAKKIPAQAGARYTRLLANDVFTRGLFSAFSIIAGEMRRLASSRVTDFYILAFAFVFFFSSAGVLLKLTKWPLLNLALMLFVAAGTLFLYAFYQTQVVPELGKYIKTGFLSTATPTIAMIILGLIFTLIDLIFIPSQFWRKEIEGV